MFQACSSIVVSSLLVSVNGMYEWVCSCEVRQPFCRSVSFTLATPVAGSQKTRMSGCKLV